MTGTEPSACSLRRTVKEEPGGEEDTCGDRGNALFFQMWTFASCRFKNISREPFLRFEVTLSADAHVDDTHTTDLSALQRPLTWLSGVIVAPPRGDQSCLQEEWNLLSLPLQLQFLLSKVKDLKTACVGNGCGNTLL